MHHTIIEKNLENGATLLMIPLEGTAALTSIVLMGVGSRYESDKQRGLAHFTEHMVFKGGKKFKSAQEVSQALDAVGGEFNAFTAQEFTGFYTKTDGEHLELGLDVLSDMILHATFPAEELEKEKGVIVEEINMYEDMPMRKVDHVLSRLAFGEHPLGLQILGSKESVNGFTPQDFLDYRKEFYKGSKCVIVLAGAMDTEAAEEAVRKYFAALPSGESYEPDPSVWAENGRVLLEKKDSEQTHLMLATRAYPVNHPKRYAFRLLSTILGGNMSSRLFSSVREQQGLCYYVRAYPDTYVDAGLLVASAGVDNARLHQAVKAILKEFAIIRDELVGTDELDRAKQFLIGKTRLAMEDSEQVAEVYGMQRLLEGRMEELPLMEEQVRAVTAEQIQDVARELFTDEHLLLAVIGPQQEEGLNDLLHL